MKNFKNTLRTLAICFVFVSCSETQIQPNDELMLEKIESYIYSKDGKVRFNGRYLEFGSPEILEETKEMIRGSDEDYIRDWLSQFGFEPMMTVYHKAMEIEQQNLNQIIEELKSKYSETELKKMEFPKIDQAEYVKKNAHLFDFYDNGLISGLRIFHPDLAYLVNKQGVLKVAGHLEQYTKSDMKIIVGGDENKIGLLKNTYISDERTGIIVNPVNRTDKKNQAKYIYNHYQEFNKAKRRIEASVNLNTYSSPIYQTCNSGGGPKVLIDMNDDAGPILFCDADIIGYRHRTVLTMRAHYRKRTILTFFVTYNDWKPEHSSLIGRYSLNGQSFEKINCFSSGDYKTAIRSLTLHDGGLADITSGNFRFFAVHEAFPEFGGNSYGCIGSGHINSYIVEVGDTFMDETISF